MNADKKAAVHSGSTADTYVIHDLLDWSGTCSFFFLFLLPFQLSALHTWSDCPEIAGGFCVSVCLRSHEKKGEVTRCGTGSGGTQRVAIPFIFTPLQRRSCIVCTNTLSGSDPTLSLNLGRSPAILAAAKQQQQGEKMERTGEI